MMLRLVPATLCAMLSATVASAQQKTGGDCAAAIRDVGGSVTINCKIYASRAEHREIVLDNIDTVLRAYRSVLTAKSKLLIPAIERYKREPSEASWNTVLDHARMTIDLSLKAAQAAVEYDPDIPIPSEISQIIDELISQADNRVLFLETAVLWDGPPALDELETWLRSYEELTTKINDDLHVLRELVKRTS